MNSINNRLKDLYMNRFSTGEPCFLQILREKRRALNRNQHPAYPFLLKVNEEKDNNSKCKIIVFGQETNSWEHKVNDSIIPINRSSEFVAKTVDTFMDFYHDFMSLKVNKNGKKSPFWRTLTKINTEFEASHIEILWNNIYKLGNKQKRKNKPVKSIRELENKYFNVINEELEIIKPKYLIFLTGPNYESRLEKTIKVKKKWQVTPEIPIRELAKFKLVNGLTAYRTYHPNYLHYNKKNNHIDLIIKEIKSHINSNENE
ncbi:uracil-DNA glycosylase family protein [Marinilabilia salmonicolor]|uniref:uracil-DNA glycosylase family protein n=1 Tax=Marinilabilia salmonicolor TaxID=989 RepID=UPI000299D974|nr:uracil-DNA glycosylase family protein [Marinilabilia salmonicolor]